MAPPTDSGLRRDSASADEVGTNDTISGLILLAALTVWRPMTTFALDDRLSPRVDHRPVAFLDRMSHGTEYSTRDANAYAMVLDKAGPEVASRFHGLVVDHQPKENTAGLSSGRSGPAQPSQS